MRTKPDISAILAKLGDQLVAAEQIDGGATSDVWKVRTNRRVYALKILNECGAAANLTLDVHLRKNLSAGGAFVAAPVLSSEGFPNMSGAAWVLDEFVAGEHPARGELHKLTCLDLGKTLAILHDIPVSDFGAPQLTGSLISGEQENVFSGLATRFTNPLPIETPPAFELSRELWLKTLPYLVRIREILSTSSGVLCHSDLHDRQMIIANNRLAALIDFGDATIGDYRWDFGSLLYFHGPRVLADTVKGYEPDGTLQAKLIDSAHVFSIGIAMHIGARSLLPGKAHRLKVATVHLNKTLVYLEQNRQHLQTD
ncbi:hypothetical protein A9Q96_13155 [Rhodobacterales bacterium 52_120_T64]|nr:hypothetical protein A9Q96_13155 [Rhodobacterales bacterium 52_120_T64]